MPATAAEYTDRVRLVARNAAQHAELTRYVPKWSACYPSCATSNPPSGTGSSLAVRFLLGAALLSACGSEEPRPRQLQSREHSVC